jgi:hypothetical protein
MLMVDVQEKFNKLNFKKKKKKKKKKKPGKIY